jgi:hypothetical protein
MSQQSERNATSAGGAPTTTSDQVPLSSTPPSAKAEPEYTGMARILHSRLALLLLIVIVIGGYATYRITASDAVAPRTVAATSLKLDDCFTTSSGSAGIAGLQVQLVSCTQPHNAQVYAVPAITDASFPGSGYMHSEADDACNSDDSQSALAGFVPAGYLIIDFYPQDASAFATQKNFLCVIQLPSQTNQSWLETDPS